MAMRQEKHFYKTDCLVGNKKQVNYKESRACLILVFGEVFAKTKTKHAYLNVLILSKLI